MKIQDLIVALALVAAPAAAAASAGIDDKPAKQDAPVAKSDAAVIAAQLPSYPLEICPISGEPVEDAVNRVYEGRLVRLCCDSCVKTFEKDPKSVIAQIDQAVVAAQKPSYPLQKCVVSDEALGSMGDPIEYVNGTRLVRFCCKSCVKSFQKDPDSFMAKVDAALITQQMPSYPLDKCMLSDKPLGDDSENVLYGTRLVRFCCSKCAGKFAQEPTKYLVQLDAASKAAKDASAK